jgi:hypothetical protein
VVAQVIDQMVEVSLRAPEDFLKVRETLTRIGVASKRDRKLYQSCHILHKRGRYFIVHFKELFMLDGKPTDFSEDDASRRNAIANLLAEWQLVDLVSETPLAPAAPISQIKVLTYREAKEWILESKYQIGKKRNSNDRG